MNRQTSVTIFSIIVSVLIASPVFGAYAWIEQNQEKNALVNRIEVPRGFERVPVSQDSFASWLRHLPLKDGKPPVYLYNGRKKLNQWAHHAVVDIDVGSQNLQQCADAVIRLRAEYFYSLDQFSAIHFNFTSGDKASYTQWTEGYRPKIKGNQVTWRKTHKQNSSYPTFRNYLNTVFMYAGTYSLERELHPVKDVTDMRTGDVFIQGGFPGHAVLVADMAVNPGTGEKVFLLAQSFMPAQEIHILRNPSDRRFSPWYSIEFGETLKTPEWNFSRNQLKRF